MPKMARRRMAIFAAAIALPVACAVAGPGAVSINDGQATLLSQLQDPAWIANYRTQLRGSYQVSIPPAVEVSRRVQFSSLLAAAAAKGCGFVWTPEHGSPDHLVWLETLADTSESGVASYVAQLGDRIRRTYPASNVPQTVLNAELIKTLADQFRDRGIAFATVVGPQDIVGSQFILVVWDGKALTDKEVSARVDYGIFFGLVGFGLLSGPPDDRQFSYLLGSGNLAQLAGNRAESYTRLCTALSIVKAICSGKLTGNESVDFITRGMESSAAQCAGGTEANKQIVNLDSTIQRLGK